MPDRILRAGILTSDPVNTLSDSAEKFYRRLMSVADDYGRYDGRLPILISHLYPLQIDRTTQSDVSKWLTECVNSKLIASYEVDGKPFIEIQKFGQRLRSASKWPNPPSIVSTPPSIADNSAKPASIPHTHTHTTTDTEAESGGNGTFESSDAFDKFWAAYPRKVAKIDAERAWAKIKDKTDLLPKILSALAWQSELTEWKKENRKYAPYPASYLNSQRWTDEPEKDTFSDEPSRKVTL